MLKYALIGILLVAVTVVIHAVGTTQWLRVIARKYAQANGQFRGRNGVRVLVTTVVVLLVLHVVEIMAWAMAYLWLLPAGELSTYEEAVYFSYVTFTTLGYGDITLTGSWRVLSGIEAMNGIMLAGWSTALLFAVVQRTWQGIVNTDRTD